MDEPPTPHTYEQAASALGIQAEAVRARLRRGALRRGPRTNDGRPTVLLSPADILTIRASIRAHHPESGPEAAPDSAGRPDERDRTISALEADALTLREAIARERERADRSEVRAETERTRAEEAARRLEEERARGEAARVQAARAEAALEELRRPFWRRWFG
jgi:hypothetical protein